MHSGAPPPRVEGDRLIISKIAPLPALCVKCGTTSDLRGRVQKFAWVPQWTYVIILFGLLPAIIIQAILTKRATFNLPICGACNARWTNARLVNVLGILGSIIGGLLLLGIGLANDIPALSVIGGILFFPGFLIIAIVTNITLVKKHTLRAVLIDDHFATLTGLPPNVLEMLSRPH
jgi:hypothetical protein